MKQESAPQQKVPNKCSERNCLLVGVGNMLVASGILLRQAGIRISGVISDDGTAQHWAQSLGLWTAGHSTDLVAWLDSTPVDYLLSVNNPRILPLEALRLPRIAAINFHDSPLPRYAGLHATTWALISGEKTHGVTWHLMDPTIDTGAIVRQRSFDVVEDETALSLNLKCFTVGLSLLEEMLPDLAQGILMTTQQDLSLRTYCSGSRRPTAGGILNWSRPGEESQTIARAIDFGPYFNPLVLPKIWTGKECLIVREVKLGNVLAGGLPGTVLAIDQESLTIATASRPLSLSGLATIDGEPLSVAEAARRYQLCIGLVLPVLPRQRVAQVTNLSEKVACHEQFWRGRLKSLRPISLLDKPRANQLFQGGAMVSMAWRVPEEVDGWLDRHGNPCRSDGFLLAAFGAFLARVGNQDRFDVEFFDGSVEAAESSGIFAKHVPFCFEIDDDFLGILERVCAERARIARHLTYPRDLVGRSPDLRDRDDLHTGRKLAIAVEIEPIETDAGFGHDLVMRFPRDGHEGMAVFEASSSDLMSMIVKQYLSFVRNLAQSDGADYAAWQRKRLSGERLHELNDYWIGQLSDLEPLELPSDHPRPVTPSHRGENVCFQIEPALLEPFEKLCHREGATLQMGLLAVVALLLHRYSRQDDFAIGVPIWGRNHPELEKLIGFFINILPIRMRFEPGLSFRKLLALVRDSSIGAYDHQELPFEQMVEVLNVERDTSRNPLVQVMLQLIELPEPSLQGLEGLAVEHVDGRANAVRFDLEFAFRRVEQGLQISIAYSTDLFDAGRIERLQGHLTTLLDGVLAAPERAIAKLPLLSAAEKSSLQSWEQGPRRSAPKLWAHQSIAAEAQRRPEATAVVAVDRSLTYRSLSCSSGRLAQLLIGAGVGPDVVVGLSVQRTSQLPIGLLAILQAGGTYLPLDPELPPARLHTLLADSGARLVLVDHATRDQIRTAVRGSMDTQAEECPALKLTLIGIESVETAAVESDVALQPFGLPELSAHTAACLFYTSGSTGAPKAVLVEHAAIADRCQSLAELWQLDQDQVVLANTAMGFDMSLRELLLPLMVGATVVITAQEQRNDPEAIIALIHRNRCSRLNATPSLWMLLASRLSTPWPMVLISGGEVLKTDLAEALLSGTKIRLINAYGPTEGTMTSCMQLVDAPVSRQPLIGRPLPNTELLVLDPEGQRCPVGVPGELHIGGAGLARGYHERPEITADRFILHPHDPGRRLYRSGDLASWNSDGALVFHGRIDGQIKLRGFRIEPGEIESHLLAHPAVAQAVVVLRKDDPANPRLIAYWVPQEATRSTPGADQLRSHLAEQLPDYMVPAAFVALEALPLTTNGKLDRSALPASDFSADPSQRDAPSTDLEHQLHGIWEEVLGHGAFGVSDNFFYVGGHSLAAARLMSRIEQVLGSALPLAALFQNPTIAGLAPLLPLQEAKVSAGIPTAEPLIGDWPTDTQVFPASFAQARLWFLQALEPALTTYHMPTLWHLQGELDPEALRLAFEQLLERQVSLRTAYRLEGEQVLQMLSSLQPFCLRHTRLPDDVSPEALDNLLQAECSAPFDLKHGPLLRALLIERGPGDHLLLITVHHIASDGWSQSLLHQDLSVLYNSLRTGAATELPPLPISYADFSVWQRQQLSGMRREQLLGYWRGQLADLQPLELPSDHPRPALPSHRGASLVFDLDGARCSGLESLCQQQGATLQMGLLALVAVLLQRYSRSDDIPIGVPHWGRNHPDLEGLVGFFVNILVLRCDLAEGPSFLELLARVRSTSLKAYEHQDLPFEELVEALQPERDRSRHPLVQVQIQLLDLQESSLRLHGMACDPLPAPRLGAKLDLSFYCRRRAGGMQCTLVYSSDLFTRGRIERLVDNLRLLLDGVLADPGKPIRQLSVLGPNELSQLQRWGIGPSRPTSPLGLHELFQQQVCRTSTAVALVFEQDSLTYSQLDLRVEALASVLRDRGARPGALVGVCLQRSLELPVALLAVLRTGAAYVAVDPAWPPERCAHILKESELQLLVSNRTLATALPFDAAGLVLVEEAHSPEAVPERARPAWPQADPEAPAYVLFTSGSTGEPKGVVVPHRAVVNRLIGMQEAYPLSAADVVLQKTPFSFDVSVWEIFWPLSVGARQVLAQPDGHRDPDHLVDLIRQQGVTTLHFVPPMLALFLQHPQAEQCTSLRRVFTGGESLLRSLQDRFFVQFDAELHHLYGPTEATIDVTAWVCHRTSHLPFVPIGRPLQNVHLYLLDSDLNPVPIGAVGELFIGGHQVALGYLNRPDLTSERFLPDPFSADPQARLFRSGDLCRWRPSGDLEFLGRQDGQVKIRGIRIELGEIEAVLAQQSGVSQCVVVVEGEEGDRRLAAYLTTDDEHGPDPAELRQNLLAVLPEVMVPSRYVLLEALPLTLTGKIDRNGLLSAPRRLVEDRRQQAHPPETPLQKQLHGLWAELLGHEDFGIHDDFFMLGGHSLAAVRLAWALQELGLFLPMGRIFATPTIAGLAAAVSEEPGPVAIPRLPRKSAPPAQA